MSLGAREPSAPGPDEHWAGPSQRARTIAVALALVLAALTFSVVNGVWRRAAPAKPAPAPARVVEVTVVPSLPSTASAPSH